MIRNRSRLPGRALVLLGLALIAICPPVWSGSASAAEAGAIHYWVAVDGNDQGAGSEDDPFLTLDRARQAVRVHPDRGVQPIYVNLKTGLYRLAAPLALDPDDSGGLGAEVVYRAAPGASATISGGRAVTGWTLHDAGLNIWRAPVETEIMPRQFYVNGQRAVRARTPDYPNYYTPTATGYTYEYSTGTDPQIPPTWENPSLVEAVTSTQWKMMRCPVADVIDGTQVIMQSPCWDNANVFPYPWGFHLLSWWENAYEFLDEPGEWFLDPVAKVVYYIPRSGEDMAVAEVELPILEKLIDAQGDASRPVAYIRFAGLTFSQATWLEPNGPDGYALDQSGFHLVGSDHEANVIGHDPDTVGIPGNLSFLYARNITFENNTVTHMGGVGLEFGTGGRNNAVVNNTFRDVSAAAIQLGGIAAEDHHPQYPSQLTADNRVANNLIEYSGQEFYDAPGIYIGFTARSLVEHNEINHVPWTGIAIGWGWGLLDPGGFAGLPHALPYQWGTFESPSAAVGNQIIHNKITYFLEKLWDGGAIYNNGFQGTSLEDGLLIAWNLAQNKRPAAGGNTFYTDGGSRFITVRQNVSLDNPVGYIDFGPCGKSSSFSEGDLCLVSGLAPYGKDMGGCVPYGDMLFENNYLADHLTFYDICVNDYFPSAPTNISFVNNVKVSSAAEVPAWILEAAGRQ